MLTDQQDQNLSNASLRSAKRRQDKENPMVVNINDGRLMPNVKMLREHPDYRIYRGPDTKDAKVRLQWLNGELKRTPIKVTNTKADAVFDVGTATRDDIIVFMMEEYGITVKPETPMSTMRQMVVRAADKAAAAAQAAENAQ
jgi:hypothetical protein